MVPLAGLEPALLAEIDFESIASTNFTTGAPACERCLAQPDETRKLETGHIRPYIRDVTSGDSTMPSYRAPIRDTRFVIEQLLDIGRYSTLPGFDGITPDLLEAVLGEGARFCEEILFPINADGDRVGCTRHPDGSVTTPPGAREAYARFVEAGWPTLAAPADHGGQGMPHVVSTAFQEYLTSANMGFSLYPELTLGAINAIMATGSEAQKALYVPNMSTGKWSGTMNLTEAHCGTDLGLIRTRATPNADGSYAITGTKIFISSGEHDLTENIIHLVLAKIAGAPDNVKGISLFIVPKILVNSDGSLGARNAVSCGALEEKMGLHGSATCVMNYDGATGWLVGEENKGLAAMFVMMNAARLGVGLQGLGIAEVAYQNAVAYARERRQGRALTGPADPAAPADPIIVHPDVRRMLMDARALIEGSRALCLWTALQDDLSRHAATPEERAQAADLVALMTPVVKGNVTDFGYSIATDMQQVFGGHGYIREWGVEQYVRDARIPMIYEGTNGIQAMDLVGRKLPAQGGRAARLWFGMVAADIATAKADPKTASIAEALEKSLGQLQAATMWLMQNGMANPDNAGAAAYPYMRCAGLVALGWMWLRTAQVAVAGLAAGDGDPAFLEAKLVTARHFTGRLLPRTSALRREIEAGAEPVMALPAEAF